LKILSQVLAFLPRPLHAVFEMMDTSTGQSISKADSDRRQAKKHKTTSVVDMSVLVL
jgi:hypothetical protein